MVAHNNNLVALPDINRCLLSFSTADGEVYSLGALSELAENAPDEFERVRKQLCDNVIESVPETEKQRLRGLQFVIDMKRKLAGSPPCSLH